MTLYHKKEGIGAGNKNNLDQMIAMNVQAQIAQPTVITKVHAFIQTVLMIAFPASATGWYHLQDNNSCC